MRTNLHKIMLFLVALSISLSISCSKDTDLFLDTITAQEDETIDDTTSNEESSDDESTDDESTDENSSNDDFTFTPDPDFENTNEIVGSYTPTSAADLSDPAHANFRAVITESFDCTNCTLATNQTIEPAGGNITGTNINLNGAFIENTFKNAFSPSTRFSVVYENSRLSPENFGANGNDTASDDAAISALITNSAYAAGQEGAVYVKNLESVYTRQGVFSWDLNNSTISTTSAANLSHGPANTNLNRYLFFFSNLQLIIRNGTFNGQNIASRAIKVDNVQSYEFDNITIRDYLSPPNAFARGIALKITVGPNTQFGAFTNGLIENIGATSDGNANNTPFGVAKAISMDIATEDVSQHLFENNTINNIYGDDAEGFINRAEFGYRGYNTLTNGVNTIFRNNTITACQRRAFKVNASNVQILDNIIDSATNDWIFSGSQATTIQVFSINRGQPISNVNVTGNTVRTIGEARNALFGITDATNCLIENNIFESEYIQIQRSISFGNATDQGGLYNGDLSNTVIFRNNTVNNTFFTFNRLYEPINGGFVFENNTINIDIDRNMGAFWAAFRWITPNGDTQPYTFKDITININQSFATGTLFGGVLCSQGINFKNITLDNIDINYEGSSLPDYPFAIVGSKDNPANFDNSNTIENCTITGAQGTGAIVVEGGNSSVNIRSSFGDNATPITAQ